MKDFGFFFFSALFVPNAEFGDVPRSPKYSEGANPREKLAHREQCWEYITENKCFSNSSAVTGPIPTLLSGSG